mgnify:CR=1|jgi:hypothetical protein
MNILYARKILYEIMGTLTVTEQKQAIAVALKVLNAYIRAYVHYKR